MARAPKSASVDRRELRRLQHQDLSRGLLLDAAEEVFGRKGYHDTTLKEVAELAGFSVGSVYTFFENKDDLFQQIFIRRGGDFMAGMDDVLTDTDASPLAQLHALLDFQVGFFRDHPHFGRLYLQVASAATLAVEHAQMGEVPRERYEVAMRQQADLFRRGQRAGELRDGDPSALSRLFSGLVASFQSVDLAGLDGRTRAKSRFSLAELHDIVEHAFTAAPDT
jgi:AcrR family transcriptional regulator